MEALIALLIFAFFARKPILAWFRVSYRQGKIVAALKTLLSETHRGVFFVGDIEKASLEFTKVVWEKQKVLFEREHNAPHKVAATVYTLATMTLLLHKHNDTNAEAVLIACANATDDTLRSINHFPLTGIDRHLIEQTLVVLRILMPEAYGYAETSTPEEREGKPTTDTGIQDTEL